MDTDRYRDTDTQRHRHADRHRQTATATSNIQRHGRITKHREKIAKNGVA